MRVVGAILPAGDGSRVEREAWCRLVDSRPEFRRSQARQAINPFARVPTVIYPAPDAAEVMVDDIAVGKVYWSMSDDNPLVNASVEPSALPLVMQWAAVPGGEFREDPSPAEDSASP